MKKTDIFDKLDNVLGNYSEGKATKGDVINIAYNVNQYLIKNAHPYDIDEDLDLEDKKPIKIPCLDYVGVLNEPNSKCNKCGKAEWQHEV